MRTMGRTVEPKFLDGFKNIKAACQQQLLTVDEETVGLSFEFCPSENVSCVKTVLKSPVNDCI